jgi:NAD(P)-dependent dehydrogenase (short-subunit alcohol dehydrogenase family)
MSNTNGTRGGALAGKVAVVTGASRGIGRAVAEALAHSGARLLLIARSDSVKSTADELSAHAEVVGARCDVAKWSDVAAAVELAVKQWQRIDVLVNAAAVLGATGELWKTDPEDWNRAIDANLRGTYHTMRAVLPHMIRERSGSIVNFAGGGAAYGYPRFSAYAASKVAVVRLTETVALECEPYGIKANVIAPGAIETEMLQAVRAAGGEVRTVCGIDEPVQLVMFLASPASDHVSGRFIHARDDYRNWQAPLAQDIYTLRRVQP